MAVSDNLLENERFLVFGAGRSGLAAARLLKQSGKTVAVYDECSAEKRAEITAQLAAFGVPLLDELDPSGFPGAFQVLILSPGIPTTHEVVQEAMRAGCLVRSEVELAWCESRAPVIAITGTNGKTTTTHLIDHLLHSAGRASVMGGNVGRAFSDAVLDPAGQDPNGRVVCEVSSFQLETIAGFHPEVAIVLNITPDHLDRYGTMDAYMEAERRITMNQEKGDALVLNAEDAHCLSFITGTRAEVLRFSVHSAQPRGAWLQDGTLYMRLHDNADALPVIARADIPLAGLHNVENILAAICAVGWVGLTPAEMADGIRSFRAVPHRIEPVGERDGVRFFNDSKATNLDSVEKALQSFAGHPVVLIAGGRDKGAPWESLHKLVRRSVKALVLIGEASDTIRSAWGHAVGTVHQADSMSDAVQQAFGLAESGDVVLLSPGCASFDMYENYERRGDDFRSCVAELTGQG